MHISLTGREAIPMVQAIAANLYTLSRAADYAGVSPHCVQYWARVGYVNRYGSPGGGYLYLKQELDFAKDHPRSKPWLRTHQPNRKLRAWQKAALAKSAAEQGEPKGKQRERVR